MKKFILSLGLILSMSTGLSAAQLPRIEGAKIDLINSEDITYHVIEAEAPGAYTVTMLETESGVLIIDTGAAFLPNFGKGINSYAKAIAKPTSILITHAHGDHFGNIGSIETTAVYAGEHVAKELAANKRFANAYTEEIQIIDGVKKIYGLEISFGSIANAELADGHNGYAYIKKSGDLFPGDLVYNLEHNFIRSYTPRKAPDELKNWVDGLKQLKTQFGDYNRVFVGHGGVSTSVSKTIDENIEYLETARQLITNSNAKTPQDVVDVLGKKFSHYGPGALKLSLPGGFGKNDPGADWFEN